MTQVKTTRITIRNIEDFEAHFAGRNKRDRTTEASPILNRPVIGAATAFQLNDRRIEFSNWENTRVRGQVSADFALFGVFLNSTGQNHVWNNRIESGDVAWSLPTDDERVANYPDPIEFAGVGLPLDRLKLRYQHRGLDLDDKILHGRHMCHVPTMRGKHLRHSISRTATVLKNLPDNQMTERAFNFAHEHILDSVLDVVAETRCLEAKAHDFSVGHDRLLRRVEDVLRHNDDRIFGVRQMCDYLRVSRRTLHRACNELLGVSSQVYLKNWRMTRAREMLRKGAYKSVADCAVDWGFFDQGRFAGYYNDLFDEPPSDTLRSVL